MEHWQNNAGKMLQEKVTVLMCEDSNQSIFYGKINFLSHTQHNALPLKGPIGEFCVKK
jgi:hypothetical protein